MGSAEYIAKTYAEPVGLVRTMADQSEIYQRNWIMKYFNEEDMVRMKNNIIHLKKMHLAVQRNDKEWKYYEREIGECFDAIPYYIYVAHKRYSIDDIVEPDRDDYVLEPEDEPTKQAFDKLMHQYYEDVTLWKIKEMIASA